MIWYVSIAQHIIYMVYNDANENGTLIMAKLHLEGYEIVLSENNVEITRDTTGADGLYSFGGIYGGTYTVKCQTLELGWVITEPAWNLYCNS